MSNSKSRRSGLPYGLTFRSIDGSIPTAASLILPPNERRGIYVYEFTDGTAYVGRSVDMARRLADHRHDYRHEPRLMGKQIQRASFASVSDDVSDAELDEFETQTIRWAESKGYDLINELKVNRPGGAADISVVLADGSMPTIPWKRDMRTNSLAAATFPSPSASQKSRFDRFERNPATRALIASFARYVAETIPEFAKLAGTHWSITAYPSRAPRADSACAACITCGTLETLVVWSNGIKVFGYINCKRPEDDLLPRPLHPSASLRTCYRAADGIVRYEFRNKAALDKLFDDPRILDWCYRLNVEMIRKSANPQARWTNPSLTLSIIENAIRSAER